MTDSKNETFTLLRPSPLALATQTQQVNILEARAISDKCEHTSQSKLIGFAFVRLLSLRLAFQADSNVLQMVI